MLMFMLGLLGFALALCIFISRIRIESRGGLMLTPFAIFGFMEIQGVWPPTVYAYLDGYSPDGYACLLAAGAFLCFLTGFELMPGARRVQHQRPPPYRDAPLADADESNRHLPSLRLLALVIVVLMVYLYRGLPPQTRIIGQLLKGNFLQADLSSEMSMHRFEITKSHLFGGEYRGQGLIRVLVQSFATYLSCLSALRLFGATDGTRQNRLAWFAAAGLITLMAVGGDGTRFPLLLVILYVAGTISHLYPLRGLRLWAIPLFAVVVLTLTSLMGNKSVGLADAENPVKEGALRLLERVNLGNGMNNVHIIELVRDGTFHYEGGAVHMQGLLNALPGVGLNQVPYSNLLAETLGNHTTTTFATATYFGSLYWDFGPLGVLAAYLLMGAALAHLQKTLYASAKTINGVLLTVCVGVTAGLLSYQGIIRLIPALAALLLIHLLATRLVKLAGGGRRVSRGPRTTI